MVAKRVPRQIGDQPVILMSILAIMREDEIGRATPLQFFEELLES